MKKTKPEITLAPEQTIEKLLDNFNFDKVRKAMHVLDWKYYDIDELPDIVHIKNAARRVLQDSLQTLHKSNKKKACNSTRGFTSTARKYKDGEILFSLDFRVADFNWSNRDTCY